MDIWAVDKFVLFLAFVVPGFISLKTYTVLGLQAPRDSAQQIIDAVTYSCVNYALLAWPILQLESSSWKTQFPTAYFAFYAVVLFLAPIVWALIWRWARTTETLQKVLPHPIDKPWDYVFRQRIPYWIIVTFKDGKKIAGRYDSKSFSSASPAPEQLYLEEAWAISEEGGFERIRSDTAGVLVLGLEISTIELFNVLKEDYRGNDANSAGAKQEGLATTPSPTAG